MSAAERIHFFRKKSKMTMRELGIKAGFTSKTADVRIAQYETGNRVPKAEITEKLAEVFGVSPKALAVPDIDTNEGLMHTLFALEDIYGLYIDDIDGEICLRLDKSRGITYAHLFELFYAWNRKKQKLNRGEISQEEYDTFRYNFTLKDAGVKTVKVPGEKLVSDLDK